MIKMSKSPEQMVLEQILEQLRTLNKTVGRIAVSTQLMHDELKVLTTKKTVYETEE